MSVKQRGGFINILFDRPETVEARREESQFQRFVEEQAVLARQRTKNIRILKINDTLYSAFNTLHSNARIRRMFVDGSHLHELTPARHLATHDHARSIQHNHKRAASPQPSTKAEANSRLTFSYCEPNPQSSQCKEKEKSEQGGQVLLLSLQEKQMESTTSSSNNNMRISVRYRRVERRMEQPKRMAFQLKKEMLRYYSNPPCSPQNISAHSYLIYEHKPQIQSMGNGGRWLHAAYNTKINLEIASLTKIMTCVLTLQLCQRYKVDLQRQFVRITDFETKVEGTSAELEADESYSIEQLLYGLMLPSGNDASLALSAFCGQLLQKYEKNQREEKRREEGRRHFCRRFVVEMNRKCSQLGMKRTIYSNSHGLASVLNKSCAADQVLLISHALRLSLFRKIVATRCFEATVTKCLPDGVAARTVRWENTHRLVISKPEMYLGIKTGTTDAAGPCLASLLSIRGREFIIIVLNSRSSKWRYKDTEQLCEWLCAKEKL